MSTPGTGIAGTQAPDTQSPGTQAPSTRASSDRRPGRRWAGRIGWVLGAVAGILVLGLVVISVLAISGSGQIGNERPFDPENRGADGTRAVAAILDDKGVDVEVARSVSELDHLADVDADTTVVVSSPERLNDYTAENLRQGTRYARRLVLVSPRDPAFTLLGIPATTQFGHQGPGVVRSADCTAPGIATTDVVTVSDTSYSTPLPGATGCFGDPAAMLILPAGGSLPETVILNGTMLLNSFLEEHDNAGVALRTLGVTGRVLWYVPDPADAAPTDNSIPDIPKALGPLILLAVFGVLAVMFWRGRRFGPLVTEPLPAVVKAVETTQARGRMYHRAGADQRAAATLRIHTLGRLGSYLGLPFDIARATDTLAASDHGPRGDDPATHALVEAVASATGRNIDAVAALLTGPLPIDDEGLLAFTTDLTALEKEVRRTP